MGGQFKGMQTDLIYNNKNGEKLANRAENIMNIDAILNLEIGSS